MNKHKKVLVCVLLLFFNFIGCYKIIEKTKIESGEYRPVKPIKAKLATSIINSTDIDNPIIKIQVNRLLLANKIYKVYSETIYNAIFSTKTTEEIKRMTELELLGDSIDTNDTIWLDELLDYEHLDIENLKNHKEQSLMSDWRGYISLDVMKFIEDNNASKNINIRISYEFFIEDSLGFLTLPYIINSDIVIPSSKILRIKKNVNDIKEMLVDIEVKVKQKKYIKANKIYKGIFKYSLAYIPEDLEEKYDIFIIFVKDEVNNELTEKISSVSNTKVPYYIDNVGINSLELNVIGKKINNMNNSRIVKIMIDGLGFILKKENIIKKYQRMSIPQKIYCIIAAAENLGKVKHLQIEDIMGVSYEVANKLSKINSQKLLN